MKSWLVARWAAGRASLIISVAFCVFALALLLLPPSGCGVPIVELFGHNFGSRQISDHTIASYDCRSIARTGVPIGLVVGLLASWSLLAPRRKAGSR